MGCLLCVHPELSLEIINYFLVHLEGFSQNIVGDWRFRSKYGVSNGDYSWILTAETGNSYSRCVANIGLEVNEVYWEDKHITLVEDLGYECIIVLVGEDKADVERPFEDCQYLCGTWVRVRRVLSIRRKRTKEIPRVLSPGIWFTRALVTLNPTLFIVSLGLSKPDKKKSFAVTSFMALQTNPFTSTAKSNYNHCIISKIFPMIASLKKLLSDAIVSLRVTNSDVCDLPLLYSLGRCPIGSTPAHAEALHCHDLGLCSPVLLGWLRSKHCISNGDHTWVLTVETCNGYSRCMSNIGLEVNEVYWEDEHISHVEDLAYESIIVLVGEDNAHVERPFDHRQYLCGTRVGVRRVLSIRRFVYTN
ncbi:LOW QUALITY PROTEIN: hypothetical protein CKAN_01056500 [Cinnamomum micranthum f. kanehirae]|uniref:Uncharacterized protein n=1 Tax=Cinnamomum micranthum f. kanehirae TaxID=337451 RepID=A0A3S3MDX8_9MAGN|nr:LOW QUALITY PROTEIN: hypothetical protein CKAN_01056500 [Cinnamomum micranthum f. kanehirae]